MSTEPASQASSPTPSALAIDVPERSNAPIMPGVGLTSFGATSVDRDLYILGGYAGDSHAYHRGGQSGALLRYDPRSGSWTRLSTVEPAQSVALVASDRAVLRVGGMQARNEDGAPADLHSVDTAARFDLERGAWAPLPALPRPRSSHDAARVGDTLFVVGGWELSGSIGDPSWHDTMCSLDLSDPGAGWVESPAPFQRRALASAAVGARLVVVGGMTPQRAISTEVDVFDPAAGTWSKGPEFPGTGFGLSAIAAGDALFASGADGVVYRWRPGDAQWSRVTTLAFPRFFHRLVRQSDDELWVVGGLRSAAGEGKRVRVVEHIDLAATEAVALLRLDVPSEIETKNRQGLLLLGDDLYAFGGNRSLGQHDFGPEFFSAQGRKLNLATLTWSEAASYPIPRQTMTTLQAGQLDLALGGFGDADGVSRSRPEVYAYDPEHDAWAPRGPGLPGDGRTQFGAAAFGDDVWIFGGLSYDPSRPDDDRFRHETTILHAPLGDADLAFTPSGAELPGPRRAFAGAVLDGRYVMVGGMRGGFELVPDCVAYDFAEETWSAFPCPPRPRLSGDMVSMGGKLYLAGGSIRVDGEEHLVPNPALEVYDPHTQSWSVAIEALPIEPKHLRMLPYGDRLLLWNPHREDARATLLLIRPSADAAPPTP